MTNNTTFKITGTKKVIENLNREAKKLRGQKGEQALIRSAAMIRRDMDKTAPKIPVDTGNLRGSWTSRIVRGISGRVGIIMGFTASYAAKVHYAFEKRFQRPDSGPLFFESAIRRNTREILRIMADALKI